MPEIGSQAGPCRIVERPGRSGMGEALLARDTRLQRKVALKSPAEPGNRSWIKAPAIAHPGPALEMPEARIERRDVAAIQLMFDHHGVHLRLHPRFQAILERMNCPPHLRGPLPPEVFAA